MEVLISTLSLLLALTLTLLYTAKATKRRRASLPPGPLPLPLIGNLHQLGSEPHKSIAKLAEIHGPIMTVQLGQVTTVVISSASAAKQVLQKQDHLFANRGVPDAIRACDHAEMSLPWIHLSPKWRDLRKVCNAEIFSYRKMQESEHLRWRKIHEMVADVGASASAPRGEAVVVAEVGFKTMLNLMSSLLMSVDLDQPGSELGREFEQSFMSILKIAGAPNLVDCYPWMERFDPQRIRARMTPHFADMLSFVDSQISQRLSHRAENGSDSVDTDVLDNLLNIVQDESQEITRADIKHLILDLFVAGTDTTSTILEWAMSEMIRNPLIMLKAKAELARTVDKGKQVKDSDIQHLPYLQAIVKESLRLHPVIPLLLPRKVLTDLELSGYTLPKDTKVLINAWAIGRDPETWASPDEFDPERFLGSEVDVKGAHFELIPFGSGRRVCVGMPLANRMLHLMLGSLVNCFDWGLEGGAKAEELDMSDVFGIGLQKAKHLRAVPIVV
uniref:Cytochrome P450 n=1 Tax=Kalanchoe fedtschenkoi TaxID=63787 RepID=A0A7N0TYK8_KALFE